jgi:hypothetical protein
MTGLRFNRLKLHNRQVLSFSSANDLLLAVPDGRDVGRICRAGLNPAALLRRLQRTAPIVAQKTVTECIFARDRPRQFVKLLSAFPLDLVRAHAHN